jgi:hypothetical protein
LRRTAITISQSAEGSTGVARIARVVVPGLPHHVTQRGNRREPVFSRMTTVVSTGDWSPRQRGAPAQQSGPIA